jgi:CRISPR-associated DxTHG motif protein
MEKTIDPSSDKEHILLTSLGTLAKDSIYEWEGKSTTAQLAPLALVELLGKLHLPIPNRVVAVVTKGAESTTWPVFQEGVRCRLNIEPERISIPDGRNSGEIRQILESVAKSIPDGANLTLDVTQGFRHFPFVFYALVLYLKSLRGVKLLGAYYGMVETNDPKPIIDLQPLLELPEWFHAVRMFQDQGTTKPMADLLQPLASILGQETGRLYKAGKKEAGAERSEQAKQVRSSVDWLEKYAFAYESALPLELEKASRRLIDSIKKLPTIGSTGLPPLAAELTDAIVNAGKKSAFEKLPGEKNWKQSIKLDKAELKRQANMIDLYLDRGQLSLAVGLMREWVVSWAIWKSGKTEEINEWLNNKNVRPRYERILGAIGASARSKGSSFTMTPEQEVFRDFWNQLTDNLRNALHHHAMRVEALQEVPASLKNVQKFWNQLKENGLKAKDSIDLPPLGGKLLISPQGMRPGVLFSALKAVQPDVCLAICSETSAGSISEAAEKACFKGHIEQIKLADPHGGFDDIDTVTESARGYLLYANEVVANMTGGTTLMGVVVQRLVEDAQKLGPDRSVKRFALIDRRPHADQENDPFVQGESHWLD